MAVEKLLGLSTREKRTTYTVYLDSTYKVELDSFVFIDKID